MEKNFKARQLIMNGLTRKDVDKVMSVTTAKDMWAAIKAMHTESEDMVNNKKFDLQREFHAFKMGEDETVSDYHSRFQILCDKMTAATVKLEDWEKSHALIHGVNSKFETTKRIMLMTQEAKGLAVAELAGKFALQEKDDQENARATRETKGTALKLTKVLKLMESDDACELEQDEEVDMMTKMVQKFLKHKASKQGTAPKKDL